MNKKSALLTVFLVVMIDLIGFGIVLPGLEAYASSFQATPFFVGLIYSSYSFAQLIFAPFWGSLSDRFGRRPVMMLSTLGASAAYVLFAFSNSLSVLLFCRLFAGMMAGNISAAQAYVADVTSDDERAKGMGLIGAAFGIGFVVGPALGGIIMKFFPENPFFIIGILAACLSAVSFVLVVLCLTEPVKNVSNVDETRITKPNILTPQFWVDLKAMNARNATLFAFFISAFLLTLGQASIYEAFPFFCRAILNLPVSAVYHLYIYMGLVAIFVQGGLIRVLVRYISEKKLFASGCVLLSLGLCGIAFAQNYRSLALTMMLMSLGASLSVPTLNSLISKQSSSQNYGSTMGMTQSFSALARTIGPAWGSALLSASARAPFTITGILVLGALWSVFRPKTATGD